MINKFVCLAVILVGFDDTLTTVDEDSGSFRLCVRIFTDPAFLPTHISPNFSLNLVSIPGTASIYKCTITNIFRTSLIFFFFYSDENDYGEFTSSNNPLVAFTSDPSTHRQCFEVNITDDGVLEDTERFNLLLTLADGSNVPVLVDPDVSEVEIIDVDSKQDSM